MKKGIFLFTLVVCVFSCFRLDAQVNLQTGAAEYSIPLYSYSDEANRIATAISLTYSAGNGLKVSEIPSAAGAGWSLNCGGFIQRIQRGEPDDQRNPSPLSNIYPSSINSFAEGEAFK